MSNIADYEGADYEGNFWRRGNRDYEDRVERIAIERLLPSGDRMLELGAGFGRLTGLYSDFRQVVLVDYSPTQLATARQRYGDVSHLYVAADIYHLPFAPGSFDVASMVRTIHHMEDPPAALRQVRSSLRAGGTLLLEYTNKRNFKMIGKWLLCRLEPFRRRWGKTTFDPFSHEPVEFYSMYFGLHPDYVAVALRDAGFSPGKQLALSYLRTGILKRLIPLEWLVRMDAALQPTGNRWQLSPSGLVRAEAVGSTGALRGTTLWKCPLCGGLDLDQKEHGLDCRGCGHHWPLEEGIYDFRSPASSERRVPVAESTGW